MGSPVRAATVLLVLLLLASGCGLIAPAASPTALPSDTPPPSPTPVPPTPSPAPSLTPTPKTISPIEAHVSTAMINFRAGPGTTFQVLGTYLRDATVSALGKAPGDEWVWVQTADNKNGWMSVALLDLGTQVADLPVQALTDGLTVTGKVADASGLPIAGVDVALVQSSDTTSLRTDATSGADGVFFAYLPANSQGQWSAQVVGVNCRSRIMNAQCQYTGKFDQNGVLPVALPQSAPIDFVYRP